MKTALKAALHALFLALLLPAAALAGFGRVRALYTVFAHACALAPGIVGDYVRICFYKLTLRRCSLRSRVSFGSFFAQPDVTLGQGVYIGAYCVLGRCRVGDRTQIASHVQILSGRRQHRRDAAGKLGGAETGTFEEVAIGADCWIGAGAIVMSSVGAGATIGAGAVVVEEIPAGVVAAGNPARIIRRLDPEQGSG